MIKSGGVSIYPLKIESVLYSHPHVLEAAVIGVPDVEWEKPPRPSWFLKKVLHPGVLS